MICSIIVKSYLKKLLMTKNFSIALKLILFVESDIKPRDDKINNEKFFRSLLDILFQYKIDVEQNKIPSFFEFHRISLHFSLNFIGSHDIFLRCANVDDIFYGIS